MKYLFISFLLGFTAINTHLVHSQQKDTNYFYLIDNKIPDGYYFIKQVDSYMKTRFGIPDTSLVKIELHDVNDSIILSTNIRLGAGNYYYDWQHVVSDSAFKSGIYYIDLYAELDKTTHSYYMKFSGRNKIVFVK